MSQETQPCDCASKRKFSPVEITQCVEMVKINISIIPSILGWFWQNNSTKNLRFSYSRLKSLRCASMYNDSVVATRANYSTTLRDMTPKFGWTTNMGSTFSDFFFTRHISHMGGEFWKWKIQKIFKRKWISTLHRFVKFINL